MSFVPKAGGGPYDVVMNVSSNAPDANVQPAPVLCLFGTMRSSGFEEQGAPLPKRGDAFILDGIRYECYLVKQDRSGGTPPTNGTWCYLTEEGG